jgi:hypothetical protein
MKADDFSKKIQLPKDFIELCEDNVTSADKLVITTTPEEYIDPIDTPVSTITIEGQIEAEGKSLKQALGLRSKKWVFMTFWGFQLVPLAIIIVGFAGDFINLKANSKIFSSVVLSAFFLKKLNDYRNSKENPKRYRLSRD